VRPLADDGVFAGRERRARAAIVEALTRLADAHRAQDDPLWTIADLVIAIRHSIEQTFVPIQTPAASRSSRPRRPLR
jgi:hypothetical protein